jgi:hypothetical protein
MPEKSNPYAGWIATGLCALNACMGFGIALSSDRRGRDFETGLLWGIFCGMLTISFALVATGLIKER